jgi:ribosomal protein S18 acetylase RimI-like enzyme
MKHQFKLATAENAPELFTLMQEFYRDQHMEFNESVSGALRQLFGDANLGRAYLIHSDEELAGYCVLTFCYSLEFHGRFGLLDELYLRQEFRDKGIGRAVAEFLESICKEAGITALRLEVGQENTNAQSLYERIGFRAEKRKLMTKWL